MHNPSFNVEHNIVKTTVSDTKAILHDVIIVRSQKQVRFLHQAEHGSGTDFKRPTLSLEKEQLEDSTLIHMPNEKESISVSSMSDLTQYNARTKELRSCVSLTLTTQNYIKRNRLGMEIFCTVTIRPPL